MKKFEIEIPKDREFVMKTIKIVTVVLLALLFAVMAQAAEKMEIEIDGDKVSITVGGEREFLTDASWGELRQVRIWLGRDILECDITATGVTYPGVGGSKVMTDEQASMRWTALKKEFEGLKERVSVKVQNPAGYLVLADKRAFVLAGETDASLQIGTNFVNLYFLKSSPGGEMKAIEREKFRFDPPRGKEFFLARDGNMLVPLLKAGDQYVIPVPVSER